MFKFKPFTMDELRTRADSHRLPGNATQAMAERPQPRPNNVRAILDLGTLVYFQWRGRSFGVPPLPWKKGAALLDAYLEARSFGDSITQETAPGYFDALSRMAKIMWQCTRPVGRVMRFFRLIGLYCNPYRYATEGELAQLAVFFLGRRTTTAALRVMSPAERQTT